MLCTPLTLEIFVLNRPKISIHITHPLAGCKPLDASDAYGGCHYFGAIAVLWNWKDCYVIAGLIPIDNTLGLNNALICWQP